VCLFLIFVALCFSTSALANTPPPEGLIVEALPANGSARGVKATATIRSEPEAVWRTLTDYAAFPEYMPHIVQSKILKREGNISWVAITFSLIVKKVNYTLEIVHEREVKPWKIAWTRVEGDLKSITGYYILHETPKGTLLEYSEMVDSGSFIPGFIQELLTKRSIPNLYKAIAEHAAQHESSQTK
jgi:ribosome-associated toxin RatA of RatAB toxin-antitoxin module